MDILYGEKINRWTILELSYKNKYGAKYYKCKCDCGNIKNVRISQIFNNTSKSCGCLQKEIVKIKKNNNKHGMSKTRIYKIWKGIFVRCYNKNRPEYKNYGGRGICVCKEWSNFETFYKDMFSTYNDNLTIDRINNNLGYSKENCRWITMKEQNNNKRMYKLTKDIVIKIRKELKHKTGKEISKIYNISESVVSQIKNFRENYGKIF